MHPSTEQLLAHADGADLRVSDHLHHCMQCRAALDAVSRTREGLRALPQLDAPEAAWSRIRTALDAPVERSPRWRSASMVAVAASAAALAIFLVMQMGIESPPESPPALIATSPQDEPSLADLMKQSRELDMLLQDLPSRPRVERVAMAATLDTIEERIQWLDFQLSYTAAEELSETQSQTLWRERVELMNSLVTVRYAQSGRASF